MFKKGTERLIKTNVPPTKIYGLLKFGKEEHIKDLYENGNLYVNSIKEFKNSFKEDHRYDPYECIIGLINSFPGEVPIDLGNGVIHNLKYEKIHIKKNPEFALDNISSFFGIITEVIMKERGLKIDNQMKEFGEYVILIYNYPKFIKMLRKAMDKLEIGYKHGLVDYYDEDSYSGDLTPFHKRNKYAYQTEFRIHLKTGLTEAITIKLGSLKGVAMIGKAKGIEHLKITPMTFRNFFKAYFTKIKGFFKKVS